MTRRVSIQLNVGSALRRLGEIYRNPADAIKDISPRCPVGRAPSPTTWRVCASAWLALTRLLCVLVCQTALDLAP